MPLEILYFTLSILFLFQLLIVCLQIMKSYDIGTFIIGTKVAHHSNETQHYSHKKVLKFHFQIFKTQDS